MFINRRQSLKASAAALVGMSYVALDGEKSGLAAQGADITISGLENEAISKIKNLIDMSNVKELLLIGRFTFGVSEYFILEITEDFDGELVSEPVVVRFPINGEPVILPDFAGIPGIPVNESASGADKVDLSAFELDERDLRISITGPVAEAATGAIDSAVYKEADRAASTDKTHQLVTRNAPGTNNGRLACAYAVNAVVFRALGRQVGGGLATANMIKVLKARHVMTTSPTPGCIIISPTVYSPKANIGHVGIVGNDGYIYSNSSNEGVFKKNFTIQSWDKYYKDRKKLDRFYFRLDDEYFPRKG